MVAAHLAGQTMKRFHRRQTITAALTFVIAIGAGHFMQNGIAGASRVGVTTSTEARQALPVTYIETSTLLSAMQGFEPIPNDRPTLGAYPVPSAPAPALLPAALPEITALRPQLPEDVMRKPRSEAEYDLDAMGLQCRPQLKATSEPGALVRLELIAPCDREAAVTVEHSGLSFAAATDRMGVLRLLVPVLANPADFAISMNGRDDLAALVPIQNLRGHERVALQTTAAAHLTMHALEFGARPGATGHVSAAAPHSVERGMMGFGGYLTRLGDPSLPDAPIAEIYSFPSGQFGRSGVVRLHIEARVTDETCGQPIDAQALQTRGAAGLRQIEVTVAMPGCEAVGDTLVLKNVLQDLKIAQN